MQSERNKIWERAKEIHNQATAEKRELTVEEQKNWDDANADIDRLGAAIDREYKIGSLGNYLKESAKPVVAEAVRQATEDTDRRGKREASKEERAAFQEFLREGTINGRRESRAIQADNDSAGGFTVPLQVFQGEIIQQVQDSVYIYGRARNFTVDRAESLGAPVLQAQLGLPTWGTELSIGSADNTMAFGKRELRPHPMAGEILVSKKILRQSGIDIEALVRDQIAYKVGVRLEQALLNGTGVNMPLGIFSTDASNPISTGTDTLAASSANIGSTAADDLIDTKYKLKQQYWNNGVWVFNRLHAAEVRKMKDANNQFIFTPGFSAGLQAGVALDQLLGSPVFVSEYAPVSTGVGAAPTCNQVTAITGNSTTTTLTGYVGAFFDPSQIWTATALSLSIQHLVELKAETNQDAFIYRMEVDGMPVLGEAFARYRLKGY
jgi:HK97 family phage major capsid protein